MSRSGGDMRNASRAFLFLTLVTAACATPAQPTDGPEFYNVEWSPDGRTIAFDSTRDGKSAVFTVSLDGALHRLTSAAAVDYQPTWSRDGRQLLFVSERDGHGEIYCMNADGSEQRRLTHSPAQRQHFVPRFSRDGRLIMFAFQDMDRPAIYGVGVMNADGSGVRVLSDPNVSCEEPNWSSDGQRVLFEQVPALERVAGETPRQHLERRQAAKQFFAIRPDGTGLERVPNEPEMPDSGLSPDGRWSAAAKCGPDGGIFVTERASGGERQLVRPRA